MFKNLFTTIFRALEMMLKAKGINGQTKSLLLMLFALALIYLVFWMAQLLALLILLRCLMQGNAVLLWAL
jgi:ABC-type arginine transport system permease subunit